MQAKYRTELQMEIDITFKEPEKAITFFSSDDWRSAFWTFETLEEVAESICESFQLTETSWNSDLKKHVRFIEGYGEAVRDDGAWTIYPCDLAPYGQIVIEVTTPLESTGVEEVEAHTGQGG